VLKRILPHLSRDEKFIRLFLQEARIAARISHSNVVQIFELGQQDEQYFMAMEYVQGWDLRQVLRMLRKIGEKMPIHYACKVVMDACAGLEAAHNCVAPGNDVPGVVHRDMSPSNILIGVDGVVKVTDFGIAKSANSGHTSSNLVKGKLPYMPPEAFGATPRADRRMDIFALGAVLAECITGVRLFQRESEAATIEALLREPIPRMSERRDGLPERLEEVLKRAVAKDPDQRYATARAMLEDLESVVEAAHLRASTTGFVTWLKQIDRTAKLGPPSSAPRGVVAASSFLSGSGSNSPKKDEPPRQ
jgi:serine/threonine protein kinase